jgi:hypothetical protein
MIRNAAWSVSRLAILAVFCVSPILMAVERGGWWLLLAIVLGVLVTVGAGLHIANLLGAFR